MGQTRARLQMHDMYAEHTQDDTDLGQRSQSNDGVGITVSTCTDGASAARAKYVGSGVAFCAHTVYAYVYVCECVSCPIACGCGVYLLVYSTVLACKHMYNIK